MQYTLEQIIIFFAFLPVLLAAIISFKKFNHLDYNLKILAILIFFALLIETVLRVYWLFHVSNLFLWPIYVAVEFTLLFLIYTNTLQNAFLSKYRVPIIILFIAYLIFKTVHEDALLNQIDQGGRLLESISLIILIFMYFYKIYNDDPDPNLFNSPMFTITVGLLLYFSGNFLIFLFTNFIIQYSHSFNTHIWITHAFLNSILYLTYAFALWKSRVN